MKNDKGVYCVLCDKFLGYISITDVAPCMCCGDCYLKEIMRDI